jgi:hypothetical protein
MFPYFFSEYFEFQMIRKRVLVLTVNRVIRNCFGHFKWKKNGKGILKLGKMVLAEVFGSSRKNGY